MLEIAQANEAFELTHRQIAQRVLESINLPQRVALIQSGLEGDAARPLDGLAAVFARLTSAAVAPLCTLLANLTDEEQRAALRVHDGEALVEQPRADKRGILLALRATADDAAIPYLKSLIEGRRWKQRQKKEEAALIAIKELAALGTPRAWQALEEARANSGGSVRKACLEALIMRKP